MPSTMILMSMSNDVDIEMHMQYLMDITCPPIQSVYAAYFVYVCGCLISCVIHVSLRLMLSVKRFRVMYAWDYTFWLMSIVMWTMYKQVFREYRELNQK